MTFYIEAEFSMKPREAFDVFIDELSLALHRLGLEFEPKAQGLIKEEDKDVGHVASWKPGKQALIVWHPAAWESARKQVDLRFRPTKHGTLVILQQVGLEHLLDANPSELLGWFTDQVAAPLVKSISPSTLGDWITDRRARRPTGSLARSGYRNPTHHRPNFNAILAELKLSRDDYLLEIGCGGGAFLKDALKSGCKAGAVDHSMEMVRLARRSNSGAVRAGRLDVREAEADSLPFGDSTFTCAVMTNVLGFLPDVPRAFAEVGRVLARGGRMIVFSLAKEARGTIAAPEPMASRTHFYEDGELENMALDAGFKEAHVERPDLSQFVKGRGIPKKDAQSFSTPIGQLLIAKKD